MNTYLSFSEIQDLESYLQSNLAKLRSSSDQDVLSFSHIPFNKRKTEDTEIETESFGIISAPAAV